MRWWRELALWLPVGVIPIANGALRLATYGHWCRAPAASLLSSSLDVVALTAWALVVQRRWPVPDGYGALTRGVLWFTLTSLNHFALGALVFGIPLTDLVAKYDVAGGETWAIVSLAVFVAPAAAWWMATRAPAADQEERPG